MKLLCTKANRWTQQGAVYDVVNDDGFCYSIEVSLPAQGWRTEPQVEIADVRIDDLKFYCGQPTGTAEFEVYEEMEA